MTKQGANAEPKGTFDKSVLFVDHKEVVEFEVPPYGTFKIRPLSRAEALAVYKDVDDPLSVEQGIIAAGCVDPPLSRNEVKRWQEVANAAALTDLVEAITDLSGMDGEEAERETAKSFPGESG